jgi:hypothetical protein
METEAATGVLAWHFLPEDRRLRWGSREIVEVGRTLKMKGKPELCNRGFHASRRIIDALNYAPGPILCRVGVGGTILEDNDKLVGTTRRVVAMADASPMLHLFACDVAEAALKAAGVTDARALGVIQAKRLWVAGDITDAEMDAAWEAAWDSARAAAWDAAWDAAWAAARGAARGAHNTDLTHRALDLLGIKETDRMSEQT